MTEKQSSEFLLLGHDQGIYYYLPKGSGQVIPLKANQHIEGNLIAIAPSQYWEQEFPGEKGANYRMAANYLISKQHKIGIYDPTRVRGRGGWWNNGKAVLHLGDRLIIDSEERPVESSNEYIYEAAVPIKINYKDPLSAKEANKISQICKLVSWEKPISYRYLAGWCAIAPICGALEWRPHVWITGAAGGGKSFLMDKIVRRIIGDIGLAVQSATTEAGIRQTLRHDARPIMFDEIEGADQRAQQRIQNILELARQASSETGSRIVKGTATGEAVTFIIRSCFAFSSIGVFATSRPDETRITVLGLKIDGDRERFSRLSNLISDTLTDEYVQRFTARSIKMIPIIRANARVFSTSAAAALGSQRAGDQIGALLAGAYSLSSDGIITAAGANEFIAQQDWSENLGQNEDTDESKCLAFLMQRIVKTPGKSGPMDKSIADLMYMASERVPVIEMDKEAAIATLGLNGFRGDKDNIVVSVSHSSIARMLRDTEWARTWGRTLKRIRGAKETGGTVRFGSTRSRGIEIPYPDDEPVVAGEAAMASEAEEVY